LEQRVEEARAAFATVNMRELGDQLGGMIAEVGMIANANLDWALVQQGILMGLGFPKLKECVSTSTVMEHADDLMEAIQLVQHSEWTMKKAGLKKFIETVPASIRAILGCRTAVEEDIARLRDLITRLESPSNYWTVVKNMLNIETMTQATAATLHYEAEESEEFGRSVGVVVLRLSATHDTPFVPVDPDPPVPVNPPSPDDSSNNVMYGLVLTIVIVAVLGFGYFLIQTLRKDGGLLPNHDPRAMEMSRHHNRY